MNKDALIDELAGKLGYRKIEMKKIVETLFDSITENLVRGKAVRIVGFGEFEVRNRIAREGINPKTNKRIKIAATKTPSFRAGKSLKDAVKGR